MRWVLLTWMCLIFLSCVRSIVADASVEKRIGALLVAGFSGWSAVWFYWSSGLFG